MRIVVRVRRAEGDLERLLGVFRRRGWQVSALEARSASPGGSTMTVHATLEGDRSPEVLARQVGRLVEVESVHVDEGESQVARLAGVRAKEV
ncbi:MAG TPA: ACT domain-containing protein [Polyangiaceae bacterium]|nr:ACT domain-containing protein [Polyangiaceae bacterium]